MNKIIIRLILPLTAALLLNACSSDDAPPAVTTTTDPFALVWSSGCRDNSTNNIVHAVSFDPNGTFSGNSVSFSDPACTTRGRAGRNVLGGTYSIGSDVTIAGGFVVTELNIVYDPLKVGNVLSFDPAPFDIAYLDPNTNIVYLGLKTASNPGTSTRTRPTAIDFNNGWTTQ